MSPALEVTRKVSAKGARAPLKGKVYILIKRPLGFGVQEIGWSKKSNSISSTNFFFSGTLDEDKELVQNY